MAPRGFSIAQSNRALLQNRSFRWLLLGGATNYAAPTGFLVVAVWAVAVAYPTDTSGKFAPIALAYLGLSAAIPTIVAAVFSGTIADRFDRRRLMLVSNFIALTATILAVIVFLDGNTTPVSAPGVPGFYFPLYLVLILPLWAVVAVASTLFRPALNASVPRIVQPLELGRANGLIFGIAVGIIVPLSLGSTGIVGVSSSGIALLPAVGLYVVAQLFLRRISGNLNAPRPAQAPSFLSDARVGYVYLWRRRPLLLLTLGSVVVSFFIAVAFVELGVYATVWLGISSPVFYGALAASSYLGVAAGAFLVPHLHFEPKSGILIILFVVGLGLSTAALGLIHTVWIAVPTIFLYGMFPGMITPIYYALVQATVPGEVVGRVLAADEVGSLSLTPVGQYVGGLITVAAGVQYAYIFAGVGSIIVAAGLAVYGGLRRLGFEPREPRVFPVTEVPEAGLGTGGHL